MNPKIEPPISREGPQVGLPGLPSARASRGMSTAALAQALGVPAQQVARWERGEASPPFWVALAAAQVLGVGVDRLRKAVAA